MVRAFGDRDVSKEGCPVLSFFNDLGCPRRRHHAPTAATAQHLLDVLHANKLGWNKLPNERAPARPYRRKICPTAHGATPKRIGHLVLERYRRRLRFGLRAL